MHTHSVYFVSNIYKYMGGKFNVCMLFCGASMHVLNILALGLYERQVFIFLN